jgi:hypothetical protein
MCRNIKPLFNFDPPATDEEIHAAALQFTRKVTGFNKPSQVNQVEMERAVKEVSEVVKHLLASLTTNAEPHNREVEAQKARIRGQKRFGK